MYCYEKNGDLEVLFFMWVCVYNVIGSAWIMVGGRRGGQFGLVCRGDGVG